MSDIVAEAAAHLDSFLMPVARARLRTMGLNDSGAYSFYDVRVGHGTLFADYELAVAARLLECTPRPRLIHEIGVGWGQLSFLLSGLGFDTVGLEVDSRRFAASAALHNVILAADPLVASRCQILNQRFPSPELDPSGALALATNLVFTTSPSERSAILGALGEYETVIVDVDRFLVQSKSDESRAAVVAEFNNVGMTGEMFVDLGSSARMYRFMRS